MCGIAGVIGNHGGTWLTDFAKGIRHRGPDAEGIVSFNSSSHATVKIAPPKHGDIHLLHARLAILDVRTNANQPMSSYDGRHWIVYNGEIYNHLELRSGFPSDSFSTTSDTETLLRLLARDGISCLPRLRGMFAFAWLDTATSQLTLVRDPLGIKPLYIAQMDGRISFASEPTALLALPWVSRQADRDGISDYITYGLTDHRNGTFFKDIQPLPAGVWRTYSTKLPVRTLLAEGKYWNCGSATSGELVSPASLRDTILKSVESHLLSDVPLGIALSGGLDSSSILACARQILGAGPTIQTVAYHAGDPLIAEDVWISLAAKNANAIVTPVRFNASDLIRDIDDLILTQGEPFGSTSIYAQYLVMREAHQLGLKVMLSGQGADELFAGYRIHQATYIAELLLTGRPVDALRTKTCMPDLTWRTILGRISPHFLPHSAMRPRLPPWIKGARLATRRSSDSQELLGSNLFRRRLREALTSTSLPMLLRYEDRNSMRWGVESRVPFVDLPLIEKAIRFPNELLIAADGTNKYIVRQAMRGLVPDQIIDRRDKIGFATPELNLMTGIAPWIDEMIHNHGRRFSWIDIDRLRLELNAVRAQRSPYTSTLWRTLNLMRWSDLLNIDCD